jgi:hypothetical protein
MLFIILLVFAVTLAIVVGNRLSTEAMAIVFGVAVGVAVGIPTSVLVAIMTRQAVGNSPVEHEWQASGNGNGSRSRANNRPAPSRSSTHAPVSTPARQQTAPVLAVSERHFTVVGGADAPLLEEDFPGNGDRH